MAILGGLSEKDKVWIPAGKGEGESHSGIWRSVYFNLLESRFGCFQSGIDGGEGEQISGAVLRHELQGGCREPVNTKNGCKVEQTFRDGFHYVESIIKVCQVKDRPLVVVYIFCTSSCNVEPG